MRDGYALPSSLPVFAPIAEPEAKAFAQKGIL